MRWRRVAAGLAFAWLAMGLWLWPTPRDGAPGDLVFPLSSGVHKDLRLDGIGAMRLAVARDYARTHHVPLVTSRIQSAKYHVVSDSGQRWMVGDVAFRILPGIVGTTRDEAVALRHAYPQAQRITIVTTRLHTRRACAAFRAVGFTVTCVSAGWDGAWYAVPIRLLYEQIAWLKYWAKGWLAH